MVPEGPAARRRRASLVVPVRNARRSLVELDRRICGAFAGTGWDFEVVYVDDCSEDGSRELLGELAAARRDVRVVLLPARRGQPGALMAGLAIAQGEVIVTLDDDLNHAPELVPALCDVVAQGIELVYVPVRRPSSFFRRRASDLIRSVLGIAVGRSMGAAISPFRVLDARLISDLGPEDLETPSVDLVVGRRARTFGAATDPGGRAAAGSPPAPSASRYTVVPLLRLAARMARRSLTLRLADGPGRAVERRVGVVDPSVVA